MNQNNLQTFIAKRIRYLRLTKGLSQEKLSELAGLGSKHIHNIENEKYNFQIQTLNKIITALEVDEKSFFNFEFPEKSEEIENIINQLEQIPEPQKTDIIDAIATLLNNIRDWDKKILISVILYYKFLKSID